MCGIFGVRASFRSDRTAAERALRSLAWRGPDGSRIVEVGGWRIGTARLAITDRSAPQPITCARTGRVIALNGAITSAADDWPRLADLARTRNDAELLLLRFAEGGIDALSDISGPYAFALVEPARDEVLIGRDPAGEKPLFLVLEHGRLVAFASTLRAVRALGVDARPGLAEQARFFRFGFGAEEELVAAAGLRVIRAPSGIVRADGRQIERVETTAGARFGAGAPIGAALTDAVRRCATAEVEVGLALSGGIDSACIAACAADQGLRIGSYQAMAVGGDDGERQRARAVAAHCGLPLVEVDLAPDVLWALPTLTAELGLPLGDPSVLAAHALARRAAADGVRVLLSGEGADELLCGYDRHRALRRLPRSRWRGLPSAGRSMGRGARLWRALTSADPYASLLEVTPPGLRRALLDPALCDGDLPPALDGPPGEAPLVRARRVDREVYLRGDLLPKLDVATMAAGIEGRCPFLDPAVLRSREASTTGPPRELGKVALRAAFADRLPTGHFGQRKRGFGLPLDRWWREDRYLPDLLSDPRTLARPHLRPREVLRALDRQRAGRARCGHALYLIVAFELQLRAIEADG